MGESELPFDVGELQERAGKNAKKASQRRANTGETPPISAYNGEIPPEDTPPGDQRSKRNPFPEGVPNRYLQ